MIIYLLAVPLLIGIGIYLSAVAWGAELPPFEAGRDRLYLIIPGQGCLLLGILCGLFAFGFSLRDIYGWMSDILTHGGGM